MVSYIKGGMQAKDILSRPRWSRDPRFAGSNPAEVDGFFQDVEILNTNPPGGTLS